MSRTTRPPKEKNRFFQEDKRFLIFETINQWGPCFESTWVCADRNTKVVERNSSSLAIEDAGSSMKLFTALRITKVLLEKLIFSLETNSKRHRMALVVLTFWNVGLEIKIVSSANCKSDTGTSLLPIS